MTKDEALKLALEALEEPKEHFAKHRRLEAITAIKEALAQPEQPKVRTGNCLRVGVCASEGHKIAPQRTWVGLTKEERHEISMANRPYCADIMTAHEEELKRRNT